MCKAGEDSRVPKWISVKQDYAMRTLESNAAARALELRDLLSQLGPSFVKIGQALSSRPDLLPQVYLEVRLSCPLTGPKIGSDSYLLAVQVAVQVKGNICRCQAQPLCLVLMLAHRRQHTKKASYPAKGTPLLFYTKFDRQQT